ncbi:AraC family transcriptional regulator [uncultured Pseudoteredinibacter sp.]|uniref:helix-turn-helix domain-containing protein n=1 Tax=uncultured Pseudoteredinibacter sp. TaxID=1641701 RepID=UPI0026018924|nr:AraC family transcriptional regulator [uncultured Pseudoteredinibacter sp.]
MTISVSTVQLLDLALRFAAIGPLCLLLLYLIKQYGFKAPEKLGLCLSIIAYIALTAPIENHHYGFSRNVLLLLTDIVPFMALWYTLRQLDAGFTLQQLPKSVLIATAAWFIALGVLFLGFDGKHVLHDINHGLGITLLLALVYLCLRDFLDDLDNHRRRTRILLVAFCSLYMAGLVSFEFMDRDIRNSWQFSLSNALFIFIIIQGICAYVIFASRTNSLKENNSKESSDAAQQKRDAKHKSEQANKQQLDKLKQLMEQDAFLQTELSIGKLAEQMHLPAHQLRRLINQELGYNNFSQYLNSYRIPWVCQQLRDPSNSSPVLSIALEAGYGSIAPFNRAFKAQMGLTPKQYRDQF